MEHLPTIEDQAGDARLKRDPGLAIAFSAFFVMGLTGSLGTTLVPAVPVVFGLGLSPAMVVQWIALVIGGLSSLWMAHLLHRIGPQATVLGGLTLVLVGCILVSMVMIPPGGSQPSYGALIGALAVIAFGLAALQVSANVCVVQLGNSRAASSRLAAAQAFNSVGVLGGVMLGAMLALGTQSRTASAVAAGAGQAYALSGLVTLAVIVGTALAGKAAWRQADPGTPGGTAAPIRQALTSGHALAGAAAIAVYVGAEGTIGSLLIPFLHQRDVLGLSLAKAGQYVAWFYWGGALAGRIAGSWLLARVQATRVLGAAAALATASCIFATASTGAWTGYALLVTGLCNAIMFPVIFALTVERARAPSTAVSGLLATATAGGAILSATAGFVGEQASLRQAFIVPMIAYLLIAGFAASAIRARSGRPPQDSRTTSSVGSRSDLI